MEPDEAFGPQSVAQNSLLLQGARKLIPVIPGCAPLGQARNPYSRSWLWIPGSRFRSPRNDGIYWLPPAAAMISCSVATWRAKAPRPVAVAVTVVCGFLPTKAFSTET
jgi:hypothetical protein